MGFSWWRDGPARMPLLCGSAALTLALAADARRVSLLEHAGRWLVESL